MATRINSLAPLLTTDTRVLVLGSMPGNASLAKQQYYAHPQNVFWPIMAELFGFSAGLSYQERTLQLMAQGVGIWDVLHSCERQGSLDSAIRAELANDFSQLLCANPTIRCLVFNGNKAATSFRKQVLPNLSDTECPTLLVMPSTSPAYAAMSFASKLSQWQAIKDWL